MQILAGSPLHEKFQMWTLHYLVQTLCAIFACAVWVGVGAYASDPMHLPSNLLKACRACPKLPKPALNHSGLPFNHPKSKLGAQAHQSFDL
jgi:hypothetical protein